MSNVSNKFFSHTHYGVSTIAAVLYAIAWLLGNQVRAEVNGEAHVLPAVVVHASPFKTSVATLDPVVVRGYLSREQARFATLEPVIVHASLDATSAATLSEVSAASSSVTSVARIESAPGSKGFIVKVRNWVLSSLLK